MDISLVTVVENPIPGPAPDRPDPPTPHDPDPLEAAVVPDPGPDPGEGAETGPRSQGVNLETGGPRAMIRSPGAGVVRERGAGVEREREVGVVREKGVGPGVRRKRGVRALINAARDLSPDPDLDPGPGVSTVEVQIKMKSREHIPPCQSITYDVISHDVITLHDVIKICYLL